MIAQYRPDIARVAEETVLTLKDLESRTEVLKNDLAILCMNLGHPEAARIAASPSRWNASIGTPFGIAGSSMLNALNPYAAQPGIQASSLLGAYPSGIGSPISALGIQTPFASPFASINPFVSAPFVGSPFAQVPPYGALSALSATPFAPFASQANPYATLSALSATPYANPHTIPFQGIGVSPFSQYPASSVLSNPLVR